MFNPSRREIFVLTFGAVFLVIFIAVRFIYTPAIDKRDTLKRQVAQKQSALTQMMISGQRLSQLSEHAHAQTDLLNRRSQSFSLFSFLDTQARQSGVKENVVYMRPFTKDEKNEAYTLATVKLKLERVNLKALITFLHHIESSQNSVSISSLSLTLSDKTETQLDAVIETQTLMPRETG